MRRSTAVAAVASVLLLAGCRGDDGRAGGRMLGADEYAAACLTDESSDAQRIDLCVGELDGKMHTIRPRIDSGIGPVVAPDGTSIAFIADGALSVIDVTGENERRLGVEAGELAWLPDGRLALIAPDKRSVETVDVHGGPAGPLVTTALLDDLGDGWTLDSFAVSPDGELAALALFRNDHKESALAVVDLWISAAELLVGPGPEPISHPAFSPDGSSLAYISWERLHVRDFDTGTDERLSPNDWTATTPIWSADGTELLWATIGEDVPGGPAALVAAPVDDPAAVRVIVGSGAVEGWSTFPVLPDRPIAVSSDPLPARTLRTIRGRLERVRRRLDSALGAAAFPSAARRRACES